MRLLPDAYRDGERRSAQDVRRSLARSRIPALARQVQAILASEGGAGGAERVVATGWEALDRRLFERSAASVALAGPLDGSVATHGGLRRGTVHEWLGVAPAAGSAAGSATRDGGDWSPPLAVLVHLARAVLREDAAFAAAGRSARPGRRVLWVGRRVWPYPRALVGDVVLEGGAGASADVALSLRPAFGDELDDAAELLERSVMIDARRAEERLWAIDAALRCESVAVVVADASGFDMASSRRLLLAAEARGGMGLFARPHAEERALSAAATRFLVRRCAGASLGAGTASPSWSVEMLRCKGVLGSQLSPLGTDGVSWGPSERSSGRGRELEPWRARGGPRTGERSASSRSRSPSSGPATRNPVRSGVRGCVESSP